MMRINLLRRRHPRSSKSDDGESARESRILELAEALSHGDTDQLAIQISEIAGNLVYEQGGVEVGPGDLVVDAGGNLGVTAAHFALQCGAGAVHSLEPVPPTYELLSQNLAAFPACRPHPFGLAAEAGTSEMTYFPGGDSVMSGIGTDPTRTRELLIQAGRNFGLSESEARKKTEDRLRPEKVSCEFRTLSDLVRDEGIERIDLLKIDVEGSEFEVLKGVEEGDWPRIRQIAAEVHEEHLLDSVRSMLEERSFRVEVSQEPLLAGTPIHMLYAIR